jgi:hypothetical protein
MVPPNDTHLGRIRHRAHRPPAQGFWLREARYYRNNDAVRASGHERHCPEHDIHADALDEFVFNQIERALLQPDLLLTVEGNIAVTDDQLLVKLTAIERRVDANIENRRPVELDQSPGLTDLQRRATDAGARHRQLRAK